MINIAKLIATIEKSVEAHNLGKTGAYCRFLKTGEKKLNPYGCADTACILYTIGKLPSGKDKKIWVETLQAMQNPEDGLFKDWDTAHYLHNTIHTTAFCIAALELFDAKPLHKLKALEYLCDPKKMEEFLDKFDWESNPWNESHKGAGVFSALVLAGEVDLKWEKRYFDWLNEEFDPKTGLLRKGFVKPIRLWDTYTTIFPHLAGTFHYMFNMEYRHFKLRYPTELVETCLGLIENDEFKLGRSVGFSEIDWVFCLNRALKQSGHRVDDCKKALMEFAKAYIDFLSGLDIMGFEDVHGTFGALCCLAELQQALPGEIKTEIPLKQILDRRPFI